MAEQAPRFSSPEMDLFGDDLDDVLCATDEAERAWEAKRNRETAIGDAAVKRPRRTLQSRILLTDSARDSVATSSLRRVISGGQSGADRAGLEAAHAAGLATGGWAPQGFLTAEGPCPELGERFGLKEIPFRRTSAASVARAFVHRTQRNVEASDATLVFRLAPSRGTDRTVGYAQQKRWVVGNMTQPPSVDSFRPCLVVSRLPDDTDAIVDAIVRFIATFRVRTLNVAGHRASSAPAADFGERVCALLTLVFRKTRDT